MGPPSRSFAADAYDCIMVRIRIGSTEYKCVARGSAPDGELPSDHQASGIRRQRLEKSPFTADCSGAQSQKSKHSSQLGNVTVTIDN
jgi:hypothetical protein